MLCSGLCLLVQHTQHRRLHTLRRKDFHDDLVQLEIQIPVFFRFAPYAYHKLHRFVGAAADVRKGRRLGQDVFAAGHGIQNDLQQGETVRRTKDVK